MTRQSTMKNTNWPDTDADVDAIVEAILADPSRAEDAKALLRYKMSAPDVVRLLAPKPRAQAFEDSDEDLWDNVPV